MPTFFDMSSRWRSNQIDDLISSNDNNAESDMPFESRQFPTLPVYAFLIKPLVPYQSSSS